ncbi:hypothetical protein BDD12DRAFT_980953 [Trichophaea hybrida]|nr:hypothetical protein BDD12DRAFT_980953 [Trichophaea hybrida]
MVSWIGAKCTVSLEVSTSGPAVLWEVFSKAFRKGFDGKERQREQQRLREQLSQNEGRQPQKENLYQHRTHFGQDKQKQRRTHFNNETEDKVSILEQRVVLLERPIMRVEQELCRGVFPANVAKALVPVPLGAACMQRRYSLLPDMLGSIQIWQPTSQAPPAVNALLSFGVASLISTVIPCDINFRVTNPGHIPTAIYSSTVFSQLAPSYSFTDISSVTIVGDISADISSSNTSTVAMANITAFSISDTPIVGCHHHTVARTRTVLQLTRRQRKVRIR